MRPDALLAAALHGAAELLPVSSSGHLAALTALTGARAGSSDVALHAAPLAVTVVAWRADVGAVLRRLDRRRVGMHALAGGIPAVAGVLLGDRRDRLPLPAGLLLGAGALGVVELVHASGGRPRPPHDGGVTGQRQAGARSRWDAGPADGLWLGVAQAVALWPGVSRLGTTVAVVRLRGFAPSEAPLLAREVGVPVTVGALLHELRRTPATGWSRLSTVCVDNLDHPPRRPRTVARRRGPRGLGARTAARRRAPRGSRAGAAAEALAALTGAVVAVPVARTVDRGSALTPYALERLALALLLLRRSHGHV